MGATDWEKRALELAIDYAGRPGSKTLVIENASRALEWKPTP